MRVAVIYVSCITRMDIIYIHEQNIHSNQIYQASISEIFTIQGVLMPHMWSVSCL